MKNFTLRMIMPVFLIFIFSIGTMAKSNDYSVKDDPEPEFARLQIIHNAADLAAETVDVFVNGDLFLESFLFRTATPFVDVPAGVELTIDIAPAGAGIENSVFDITVEFEVDETYVIIANGIVSEEGYDPLEPFTVYPFAPAREMGENADETDLLVFHGSTDAPEVSVWAMGGESALFTFEYGEFAGYLGLPTDDYVIEIRTADGETTVVAYSAPLATLELEGAALTVVASGFFIPENNSDGPAFGLFVATAEGGDLIPLPVYEEPEVVTCAFSQGYWFARPQTVWPYDVEVGGLTFTQEEGAAFWPPNTNTRRAFTQYSAIYLSGVTISLFPELEDAIETIDNYFANYYPAPAGIQINQAAGFIGDWIDENHCDDQVIPEPELARVQIIHNAADLAAESVDVFVNGDLFLESFLFRTATPFVDVPAGVELTIDIAPAGAGIENSVFDITVEFEVDETYLIIANGIVSEEGYDPLEPFTVYPFAPAREMGENADETDLLVFHGSTDAPEVSVWAMGGESALFTFEYGGFAGYLGLPTDDYVIEIRTADGETTVVAYSAPLATLELEGAALTVVASGFFIPENNSDGPAFGLFAATAEGGDLIPLPVYEEEEEPTTVVDIILESEIHTTLAAAVAAAGLVETLQGDGPFTVFAPTDEAFDALPDGLLDDLLDDPEGLLTDILLYHVVGAFALSTDLEDGQEITTLLGQDVVVTITNGSVFINDAEVILADLVADNGVVHVIDAVLVPEEEEEPTTVVDIILESEIHTTLAAAVAAAGLVETLQGDGPFTVFAPTDDAFAALPEGLLDDLLDDPEGLLTDILLYHVVGAFALSTDLEDGQEITTLLGQDVVVTITNGSVFINDAEVILADLVADNGVVHVIDAVLVPEEEPEVVTCAFSQGYWFARPQTVWPYDVEVGGLTFTQEEGAAFWPPNTNTRRAFTQYSAIYLSGVTISLFPELEDAMETIDNYFANYYPAPAGIQINRAAGFIGKWINSNHCEDYEYNYNNQNIFSLSTESPVIVYPNPFRTRVSMQFSIEESSRVKLEVYNLVGERIAVLFDSYVNEYDIHSVSMDADNLPNGIYFYRFSTDKEVFMDKLILAR